MPVKRPTSPHLTIYKPQASSMFSIAHRISGVALYAGTVIVVAWLWMAAYAPQDYAQFHRCLGSLFGQILLFGWTLAFYYHLANGIRHLVWDTGHGLTVPEADRSALVVAVTTLALTAGTWMLAYGASGQ